MPFKNWKECAWNNLDDSKDHGLIKECIFTKNFSDTVLHVYWTGVLRVTSCTTCCKRWYFTFNGAVPQPIDGIVYLEGQLRILTVSVILRVTATTSTKERCAWDSGSAIVAV